MVTTIMFSYADSYKFVANLSNVNIYIWTAKHIQYFKNTIQLYNTVKLFHFYRYKVYQFQIIHKIIKLNKCFVGILNLWIALSMK